MRHEVWEFEGRKLCERLVLVLLSSEKALKFKSQRLHTSRHVKKVGERLASWAYRLLRSRCKVRSGHDLVVEFHGLEGTWSE